MNTSWRVANDDDPRPGSRPTGGSCPPDHLARHYCFEMLSLRIANRFMHTPLAISQASPILSITALDFCLHARSMIDFFTNAPGRCGPVDEMTAADFSGSFASAIPQDSRLQELGRRIDRHIDHLHYSTEAADLTADDRATILQAIEQDHASFLASIPDSYRQAILARCR